MQSKSEVKHSKKTKVRFRSARDRVQAFLNLFDGNANVLVLINPDPDSMASALAVKRLLWKHVRKTVIAHIGKIKRLDNLAMMELLKMSMVHIDKVALNTFTHRILVDSQPEHSALFESLVFDAIIDHHPKEKDWDVPYKDIRPQYGANSTIMTEYLRGLGIKPSMRLATALLYAIKTDTANFERGGVEEDVKQFRYLFRYADMNLLKKIEKSEFSVNDLGYFQTALENRIVTPKGIYSHLGEVSSADICVQVADFLTRVYGLGWIFISGVYEKKVIIIIRNDGDRKDAGKLAKLAFGEYGSAGGHKGAARAEIPLEVLKGKEKKGSGFRPEHVIRKILRF